MYWNERLRIGAVGAMLAVSAPAFGYNIEYCVAIDVSYQYATVGDNWTNNAVDKNARWFNVEVDRDGGGYDFGGLLDEDGCITVPAVVSTTKLLVHPVISVGTSGNDIGGAHYDSADVSFPIETHTTDETIPVQIDFADESYAQLVLAAYLIDEHPSGIQNFTFDPSVIEIDHDGCCSYEEATNEIHLGTNADNKWLIATQVGYAVARNRLVKDLSTSTATQIGAGAAVNGCDGGPGWLTKRYQSKAIVDGVAGWYSLITWNLKTQNNCDFASLDPSDFDLNSSNEYAAGDPVPCDDDPSTNGTVDGSDWLDDAINLGVGCTTPLTNRSVEYDWWWYLWKIYSKGTGSPGDGLTAEDVLDIYVAVDPTTWDEDGGTGPTNDDPWPLWEAQATSLYSGEHGAWDPAIDH